MHRRIVLAGVALALGLAVPAGVLAGPATGSGFTGRWESVDFDGSHQTLVVSAGARPSVVYQDFYASGCDTFGGPATHWVAAGKGSVEGDTLFVAFHKSGCGTFGHGGYEDVYLYDASLDTVSDLFGIVWTRA